MRLKKKMDIDILNVDGKKKLKKHQKEQLKIVDRMLKSNSLKEKLRVKGFLENQDMFNTAIKRNEKSIASFNKDMSTGVTTGRGLYTVRNSTAPGGMNTLNTLNSFNHGNLSSRAAFHSGKKLFQS
jgi:hypothetical protein